MLRRDPDPSQIRVATPKTAIDHIVDYSANATLLIEEAPLTVGSNDTAASGILIAEDHPNSSPKS